MNYTYIIIAITAIVSIIAFNDRNTYNKLILYPYAMNTPSEYYRLLSSGFIHADWGHLIFNMVTFYSFGSNMELICNEISNKYMYIILYLSGIVVASLPAFFKHRNHSLGASGGVSAVLFATIYFFPWAEIGLFIIPKGIPGILYGVLFLAFSAYMSRKGSDNIAHDAHFWGSVYGFVFAFVLDLNSPYTHGFRFINQIMHPQF